MNYICVMSHVVLVVEDETDIRKILCFNLRSEGYEVLKAGSAEEGMKLMSGQVSLILLDVMLPGMSGFEMARKLREHDGSTVPIIFMTALGDEEDILEGFSSGADDYISKPFSFNELNARIKAILRRTGAASQDKVIQISGLRIDTEKGTVCVNGSNVELSRKEFDLLVLLARHPGTYFSRATIIDELWKDAPYVLDRTIDVHFARIRTKLGPLHNIIRNKTGFGYYIDPDTHES